VEHLNPFLVGGPAFSGTTLLALLLNQPGIVCLDEPDFEKPSQAHRGIPVLRRLFPEATLPAAPTRELSYEEAFDLFRACAVAVRPTALGFKTCGQDFVSFARLMRDAGLPVVAIVRDIRDALVAPLPPWSTEDLLNVAYRLVWENRGLARACIRYEDLVRAPDATMAEVGSALGLDVTTRASWAPAEVPGTMLKLDRHDLLRSGGISSSRVGIWRQSGRTFSPATSETALMMGYERR
jgi:hypothetical protein